MRRKIKSLFLRKEKYQNLLQMKFKKIVKRKYMKSFKLRFLIKVQMMNILRNQKFTKRNTEVTVSDLCLEYQGPSYAYSVLFHA